MDLTASSKQQTITFVGDNCSFASENGNNLGNTDSVDYGTKIIHLSLWLIPAIV